VASTLTALIVYMRKGHLRIRSTLPFLIFTLIGTIGGAHFATYLPVAVFKWLLIVACPIILIVVLKKDSIQGHIDIPIHNRRILLAVLGLLCGFYDGVFGPGGGTFMFLALTAVAGLPLLQALATSKLANVLSAGGSLTTYAIEGYVHWGVGLKYAGFVVIGAVCGSTLATRRAQKIVKPVLVIVILLLLVRMLQSL
jgi:uncharacterized membrane protein YfcA